MESRAAHRRPGPPRHRRHHHHRRRPAGPPTPLQNRPKTGTGAQVGIIATSPDDPLDAVTAWVRWRNHLAAHVFHTGPAWRAIDRYGRRPRPTRLTTKSIDAIIARRAEAAGLVGDYGGHSLRGLAAAALAAGASERAVHEHGRWHSAAAKAPYLD